MMTFAPALHSQESRPAPAGEASVRGEVPANKAADQAWATLLDHRKSAGELPVGKAVDAQSGADRHKALADAARDFYTTNPGDVRAGDARNLEVLALISAAEDGDKLVLDRLKSAVGQLRQGDFPEAVKSRGVAAYEFTEALRGVKERGSCMDITVKIARSMIREFPTADEGYEALWAVARAEEGAAAATLAQELIGEKSPAWIRVGAQNLIGRQKLAGQNLSVLLGDDYAEMLAALPADEPVAVYAWSAQAPGSIALGQMIQARRFAAIGICLDANVEQAASMAHKAGMGGEMFYDKKGALGAAATRLHLDIPGQIYLIDGKGIVREINGTGLEEKFRRLGFETRPITPPEPYNPTRKNG